MPKLLQKDGKDESCLLDTNVILSKWVGSDPYFAESNALVSAIEKDLIAGFFSGLGLVEVASVVERQRKKFASEEPVGPKLSMEFIKAIKKVSNLAIVDIILPAKTIISGSPTELSAVHWISIEIAIRTALKSLDCLHLGIAYLIPRVQGIEIDYFVTGDGGILAKAGEIRRICGFSVVNPKEFTTLEGWEVVKGK